MVNIFKTFIIIGIKMLKKPYLNKFIFFVSLIIYSNCCYCMDLGDDTSEEDVRMNREARWLRYAFDNRDNSMDVQADTPIIKVIKRSVKRGTANALSKSALNVITTVLQIIPYSVNKLIAMIKIYAYKWSFGTTGLTVKDLTKFNNRIQSLCSSLASSQTGNLRKTRRATAIEGEQSDGQYVDTVWLNRRLLLISELEHVVEFLRKTLPCYNSAFQSIDASILEKQMAAILYALSIEDNNEIQSYIMRLIGYIRDLINLLESFSSFDNAIDRSDETKAALNIIRLTFEHISTFLVGSNVKGAGGFQKAVEDLGGNKRDLMDLLGNAGLK